MTEKNADDITTYRVGRDGYASQPSRNETHRDRAVRVHVHPDRSAADYRDQRSARGARRRLLAPHREGRDAHPAEPSDRSSTLRDVSSYDSRPVPEWLPPYARDWLNEHGALLDIVYERFAASGEWPNAIELQRELFGTGADLEVVSALAGMPSALGRRDHQSDEVSLSLFGLGCVPAAKTFLGRYVEVLRLALERFAQRSLPNRIARDEIVERLGLDDVQADRLSRVILADCPFLSGGDAGLRTWDLGIDERVVTYRAADSPEKFLAQLADVRALARQPNPRGPMMSLLPASGANAAVDEDAAQPTQKRTRAHRLGKWAAGIVVAAVTATLVGLFTGLLDKLVDAVGGDDAALAIDVERDPARFDATLPYDWERYDYVIDRPVERLPRPPRGTCRERFAWARDLGGRDAFRSKIRVYLRGKSSEPVIVQGFRVQASRSRPSGRGTHVACPVGGAVANPLMIYVNLDKPSARFGRIDERPRRFLLTVDNDEVETLEVQAQTTRYDAEWWLELEARVGGKRKVLRIDDGGRPFRTAAPRRRAVAWDGRKWQVDLSLRQSGPLP